MSDAKIVYYSIENRSKDSMKNMGAQNAMPKKKKKTAKPSPMAVFSSKIASKAYTDRRAAEHAIRLAQLKTSQKDELLKLVTQYYGPRGAPSEAPSAPSTAPLEEMSNVELVTAQASVIDENNDDFDTLNQEIEARIEIQKIAERVLHLAISRGSTRANILEKVSKAVNEFKF